VVSLRRGRGTSISGVKQAKIMHQAERVDAIMGKGRSRGYEFVEMYTHADTLHVLQWEYRGGRVAVILVE
jgi:nucleolar protein 4